MASEPVDVVLSVGGRPPARERADAARNRLKVLAAAEKLFAEAGTSDVTMEDIAREAGIGRATLYRRYPDPISIAQALLGEHEADLQQRILFGEPPLGPGAPPEQRLAAFYAAMTDLLERHLHLVLGAETGRARFRTGVYAFWRKHVQVLVQAAGVDAPPSVIDTLMAPLAPELYEYQRAAGLTSAQITDGLAWLATRTLCPPRPR
ncbi:helix-turn-helix domain-containing protein [Umezawaea sp. Da 62-37]|uniref:TetR/AcrR family transcriptional regulator n=1 Tax=Umezawaea sp. Da 62-37 TaxID=3075927 RepID=UPI0028F72211|nr:helix-turn-helix domain-containing protein [Umezawaea sp. Da 62-37]WNV85413.1 helix-turn-helix domain-containing protein [Umezawaea sp. Da 62-37]